MNLRHQKVNCGSAYQNNFRLNEEFRTNTSHNMSMMPRPFGLHHTTLNPGSAVDSNLRLNRGSVMTDYGSNLEQNRVPSIPRVFATGLKHQRFYSKLGYSDGGFSQDFRNNVNHNLSAKGRSIGLQNADSMIENTMRLQHNSIIERGNNLEQVNISSMPRTFGSSLRNAPLNTELRIGENIRLNEDEINNIGFRRPFLSSTIRGRSSVLSSRLFSHEDTERYNKNLSNINSFNSVTHTLRRGFDTMSEFKLPVNTRNNWMDNHSVTGSTINASSMKAQFVNLLENLHHSLLNTVPNLPAEAIKMEFDKVKKGLDRINEMSFFQEIKDSDVISVSSNINKTTDIFSKPLKTGKEILEGLFSSNIESKSEKNVQKKRNNKLSFSNLEISNNLSGSEDDRKHSPVFKKPKPFKRTRIKTPQVNKSLISKLKKKVVNLKQWYPIAVGPDLSLGGVNEEGAEVKTEAIKKRIKGRKIELVNGLVCNLIGSPLNTIVSVLPEKLARSLKNGLTSRWRVLQRELSNCQTAEDDLRRSLPQTRMQMKNTGKERSWKRSKSQFESPLKLQKEMETSMKNKKKDSPPQKVEKELKIPRKARKQKISPSKKATGRNTSTPKSVTKSPKTIEMDDEASHQTRSGRTVKPVIFFSGNDKFNNLSTSSQLKKNVGVKKVSNKMLSAVLSETPVKKVKRGERFREESAEAISGTPTKKKTSNNSFNKTIKIISTPFKKQAEVKGKFDKRSRKNSPKISKRASPRKKRNNYAEIETKGKVAVHSLRKESAVPIRSRQTKRKREIRDADSMKTKRSKSGKVLESEVESNVEDADVALGVKKLRETEALEVAKINDFEDDFELELDDIDIPEVGSMKIKPQLSRSQLRIVSSETPPLKYFNTNLNLLRNLTPIRSPDWCMSQRTESEVKQFQKRRAEAHKKIIRVEAEKTIKNKEKTKVVARKDLKNVLDWVAERDVRSPQWNSKVLQYVIRSRKQMEQDEEEEDTADTENDFL